MASRSFGRLFTRQEADQLVPRLEVMLKAIQRQARGLRTGLENLVASNAALAGLSLREVVEREPALRVQAAALASVIEEFEAFGCLLKDVDRGLVDFPARIGGKVAFLCWQSGEPHVLAWHSLEAGFAGRQPLPGAAKPLLN